MKDLCKVNKKLNKTQGLSHGRLYLTDNNKIIKVLPIKKDTEGKWLDKVNNIPRKNNINRLFIRYLEKKICKKYNYYLFDRFDGDLKNLLVKDIGRKDKKNILFQCLLATYILNHKLRIYHNDLYYTYEKDHKLTNFMYKHNKEGFKVQYDGFIVDVNRYNIKMIDFGNAQKYPALPGKKYYPKEIRMKSECFLVGYYFFLNALEIEDPEDIRSFFIEGGLKIIEKLKKENSLNFKNYDKEIIEFCLRNFDDIYDHYNTINII